MFHQGNVDRSPLVAELVNVAFVGREQALEDLVPVFFDGELERGPAILGGLVEICPVFDEQLHDVVVALVAGAMEGVPTPHPDRVYDVVAVARRGVQDTFDLFR